jgi:ABC-type antimicrobial peptide transport system permease subunit
MAMGATRGSVLRLVLRDIASLLVTGLVIGAVLVTACSRLVASLLYGLKPYDPLTLTAACAVLTLVAALAAYLPARAAAQMDPLTALREE